MHGRYPDPASVDWRALEHARMQVTSGVVHELHVMAQALDDIGSLLYATAGREWKPISDRFPQWPDERDPRFRKVDSDEVRTTRDPEDARAAAGPAVRTLDACDGEGGASASTST